MAFPSTIGSFTNPTASNKLNSPSHSAIETAQNNELVQIETVVGVDGASSVLGTIIGDLRSPGSNGGGHIQTANKGGTGQTAYTKGDLLIATSTSVLAKLAVGTDGQNLVADSTTQAGIKWNDAVSGLILSAYGFSTAASITAYVNLAGNLPGISTTEPPVQVPFPLAGTIRSFYVNISSVQAISGNMILTVRKNAADTPMTITIPSLQGIGVMSNTTSSVVLAAGDLIDLKITNNSSVTSAQISAFSFKVA